MDKKESLAKAAIEIAKYNEAEAKKAKKAKK